MVPVASIVVAKFGNWDAVFMVTAAVNAIAALMALFVLKPMRARFVAEAKVADEAANVRAEVAR